VKEEVHGKHERDKEKDNRIANTYVSSPARPPAGGVQGAEPLEYSRVFESVKQNRNRKNYDPRAKRKIEGKSARVTTGPTMVCGS
jgi:hypothetical protein